MELPSLIIGGFAIIYGMYTLTATLVKPSRLKALGILKERFGKAPGAAIHLTGYSLIPIAFGLLVIYKAVNGDPIF